MKDFKTIEIVKKKKEGCYIQAVEPEQKADGVFDEVEDAMDKILGGISEKSQSEPEGIPEPEFTEGNASDVLPEMIILDVEQVAELLEAWYTMEEIESMQGVQIEADDTPAVELVCF